MPFVVENPKGSRRDLLVSHVAEDGVEYRRKIRVGERLLVQKKSVTISELELPHRIQVFADGSFVNDLRTSPPSFRR